MKNIILIFFLLLSFYKLSAQDFWHKINTPDSLQLSDVFVDDHGSIFICSWNNFNKGGVYRSDDDGNSWVRYNNGLLYPPTTSILSLAKDNKGTLYCGGQGRLYKSYNNGNNWIMVSPIEGYSDNIFMIRCGYDSIILAGGGNENGIIRSGDNGLTWQTVLDISHPLQYFEEITDIQFGPNGVIYACSRITLSNNPGMVYASYDTGRTWQVFSEADYPMALGFDNQGRLLRGEFGFGLFRYDFTLSLWEHILYNGVSPQSILTVPDGNIFLACGYYPSYLGGVMLSQDTGNTFQFINSGFLSNDKDSDHLVKDNIGRVLVFNSGLYRSYDTIFNSVKKINVEDNQLLAYPNPFHEKILIEFHGTNISTPEAFILIYNSTGQLIHQAIINCKEEYCWDAATFPTGVYLIKFYNGKSTSTIKVIHY